MAIIDVCESWTGQDAGWAAQDDGKGTATAKRQFTVLVSNSPSIDSPVTVLASPLLPQKKAAHPYNQYFRCRGSSIKQVGPTMFEVTSDYATNSADIDRSPLDEPAQVNFDSTSADEPVDQDIYGNPIVTANGEPIEGVTMPIADLTAVVTRNIPVFNPVIIYEFTNTINSGSFLGFPPGVVRVTRISAQSVSDEDFSYWTATMEFAFRKPANTTNERSWWKRIRHEGTRVKRYDTAISKYVTDESLDTSGVQRSKPVMLKLDGTAELDPTVGHWIEWPVMRIKNFGVLNLGL